MYEKFVQLYNNSVVYIKGNILSRLVGLMLIPIYTRVFSPEDYGVLDIVIISTMVITTLGTMGMDTALSLFYFETEDKKERKLITFSSFIFLMLITVLICGVVILFSQQITTFIFGDVEYAKYLIVATLTIPFTAIVLFCANIFKRCFEPVKYFYIILGNSIFGVLISIYLVVFRGIGLMGAFYGVFISALFFAIISIFLSRNNFNWKFSFKKIREMLKVGLPLAPSGLAIWIMDSSGRYFLADMKTMGDVGLYSVGFKFASIFLLVIVAFRLAYDPFRLSVAKNNHAKLIYSKVLTYYLFVAFFMAVVFSIFGKEMIGIFVSSEYIDSYKIITPLVISFIIYGLYPIVGVGLVLNKKTKYIALAFVIGAIVSIPLNMLLIPVLGILGAALAVVLTYFLSVYLIYFWNQKYYYIDFEIKKNLKIFCFAVVLIIAGLSIDFDSIILNIILKLLLIVFFAIVQFSSLEPPERKRLKLIFKCFCGKIKCSFLTK